MDAKDDMIRKFRQFLNIHWLRPEAAFFKIYDYSILRDLFPLPEPSVDIACGDGITSFIWAGGEFDHSFDMYQSVRDTDIMYDKNIDVFDSYSNKVHPNIVKRPDWQFTCGLDLKGTLIKKADTLKFYGDLKVHDLDTPMPFQERFNSAFSTTFFAPGKPDCFDFRLREVNKILKPEGRFVFRVHETKFKKMMFKKYHDKFGFEWAKLVDRFIYEMNPDESYDINWWTNRLEQNGFEIIKVYSYVPRLISLFYLTGFRPMFNSLMKMYTLMDTKALAELKKSWVRDLENLLTEFIFEENVTKLCPEDDTTLYIIDARKIKPVV